MTDSTLMEVARARRQYERANARLRAAVSDAVAAGHSLRTVADKAGITHVTAWRWLREQDGLDNRPGTV
jgi:hypothetical protein